MNLQYIPIILIYPRSIPRACNFDRRKAAPGGAQGPPRGPGLGHFSEVIDFDDVGRETLARWDLESEVEETQTQGFPSSASERLVKG